MTTISEFSAQTAAVRRAIEWFDQMIDCHERSASDLRSQRETFLQLVNASGDDKPRTFITLPDVIGFAVNAAQNASRNLRLDLAPTIASELTTAFRKDTP